MRVAGGLFDRPHRLEPARPLPPDRSSAWQGARARRRGAERARAPCDETGRAPPASRASPDGARVHPSGGPRVALRQRDRVREGRRVGRRASRSEPDARRLSSAAGGTTSPPSRRAPLPIARAPSTSQPAGARGATAASLRCALVDLYLVRHAIAEPRNPARWPDDSLRPLSPEGVELFRLAARGLERIGVEVEAVLASSYARAWRTAEILAEEAGLAAARGRPGARGNKLGFRGARARRLEVGVAARPRRARAGPIGAHVACAHGRPARCRDPVQEGRRRLSALRRGSGGRSRGGALERHPEDPPPARALVQLRRRLRLRAPAPALRPRGARRVLPRAWYRAAV